MHSCWYEGWVSHRRSSPVEHRFRYRLSMLYLDLDEWETNAAPWRWPRWGPPAVVVRRRDHVGPEAESLKETIRGLIRAAGHTPNDGPVRMLTQPRTWGFLINPVAFFFCFDRSEELQYVVAEVQNTPWRERHCYVREGAEARGEAQLPKVFHVSPFLPMDMHYRWGVSVPGEDLQVKIENFHAGEQVFAAALRLERRPLTAGSLAWNLIRFPLMTQRIGAAIYWQAFQLWSKRCPFYPHPKKLSLRLPTSNPQPTPIVTATAASGSRK